MDQQKEEQDAPVKLAAEQIVEPYEQIFSIPFEGFDKRRMLYSYLLIRVMKFVALVLISLIINGFFGMIPLFMEMLYTIPTPMK